MFSITHKQTSDEWVIPQDVFVSYLMKYNRKSVRASNLVFVTDLVLEPYEAFKQTLDEGARKKTFPKPDGVDGITHLVLCDTYRSASKLKNHRLGRKTLQDLVRYGYVVVETEKTEATLLPAVIPSTISNRKINLEAFNRRNPQTDVPAPPAKKARVLSEEEKDRMQEQMNNEFGYGRVRFDFC